MKKLVLVFSFLLIFPLSIFSQQGWVFIYTFEEDVSSICFIDSITGFAGTSFLAGTKKIIKTIDAGYTWTDVLQTDNGINNIYFYNHNIGFAVCENGKIYKTTDSGINWILLPLSETDYVYNIFFLNENVGWACIGAERIIKTTDGGNNWTSSITPNAIANRDVEFINENVGYVVGVYAKMFKSTDGGTIWNQITEPSVSSMFDIEFLDENSGFLVGGDWIAKTTDDGDTWNIVNSAGGTQLNSITTFGNKFAWVVGTSKIYYTSNGGANWIAQSFTPDSYLQKVSCVDSVNVWVLGDKKLYRTTSGGILDVNNENNYSSSNFLLGQNYPNPFNPSTKISWQSPVGSWQTLKVYDVLGNLVATLVDEYRNAVSYEIEFNPASSIKIPASGVYFYRLQAGDYVETKKMIFLK